MDVVMGWAQIAFAIQARPSGATLPGNRTGTAMLPTHVIRATVGVEIEGIGFQAVVAEVGFLVPLFAALPP